MLQSAVSYAQQPRATSLVVGVEISLPDEAEAPIHQRHEERNSDPLNPIITVLNEQITQ